MQPDAQPDPGVAATPMPPPAPDAVERTAADGNRREVLARIRSILSRIDDDVARRDFGLPPKR